METILCNRKTADFLINIDIKKICGASICADNSVELIKKLGNMCIRLT